MVRSSPEGTTDRKVQEQTVFNWEDASSILASGSILETVWFVYSGGWIDSNIKPLARIKGVLPFATELSPPFMKVEVTKGLLERYDNGDHITDEECKALHSFYTDLADKLQLLGARFQLAYLPVRVSAERLASYVEARAERKRQK